MEEHEDTPPPSNGIWIPIEIWETEDLTPIQRILLAEIDSLDTGEGCFAGNEFLASKTRKSIRDTKRILEKLRKAGWLRTIRRDNRKRYMRTSFSTHNPTKGRIPGYKNKIKKPKKPADNPYGPPPNPDENPTRRDVKGLWIPKQIWDLENLSINERVALYEIDSFDIGYGCWAGNKWFAERLNIKEKSAKQMIYRLKKKGLVYSLGFDGDYRYLRTSFSRHREAGEPNFGGAQKTTDGGSQNKVDEMSPERSTDTQKSGSMRCPPMVYEMSPHGLRNVPHSNTVEGNSIERRKPSFPSSRSEEKDASLSKAEEPPPSPQSSQPGTTTQPPGPEEPLTSLPSQPGDVAYTTAPEASTTDHGSQDPEIAQDDPEGSQGKKSFKRRKDQAEEIRKRLHQDPEARFLNQAGLGELEDESDPTVRKFAKYRDQGDWRDGDAELVFRVMFSKNGCDMVDSTGEDEHWQYKKPPVIEDLKTWVDNMIHTKGYKVSYLDYAKSVTRQLTGAEPGPDDALKFDPGLDGKGNHWDMEHFKFLIRPAEDDPTSPDHIDAITILSDYEAFEDGILGCEHQRLEPFLLQTYEDAVERQRNQDKSVYSPELQVLMRLVVLALYEPYIVIENCDFMAYGSALKALANNPGVNKEMLRRLGRKWKQMLENNVEFYVEQTRSKVKTWTEMAKELRAMEDGVEINWDGKRVNRVDPDTGEMVYVEKCNLYDDIFKQ